MCSMAMSFNNVGRLVQLPGILSLGVAGAWTLCKINKGAGHSGLAVPTGNPYPRPPPLSACSNVEGSPSSTAVVVLLAVSWMSASTTPCRLPVLA